LFDLFTLYVMRVPQLVGDYETLLEVAEEKVTSKLDEADCLKDMKHQLEALKVKHKSSHV